MRSKSTEMPVVTPWLQWGFERYVGRFLRRNFHAVRIARESLDLLPQSGPILVYANHPGWWDPLMAVALRRKFWSSHRMYTPIDHRALTQYPLFRRLGFYGLNTASPQGAKDFLRITSQLMRDPQATVWLAPQGRFCDPREAVPFEAGLGHLATRLDRGSLVPLAIEYAFWEEKEPEALLQFGPAEPLSSASSLTKTQWTERLEERLQATQARLAAKSMARDASAFDDVLAGREGVGGAYDVFRRLTALLSGQKYKAKHSLDGRL